MKPALLATFTLGLAAFAVAQRPVLQASEVSAWQQLREWQRRLDTVERMDLFVARGYELRFFGYDAAGQPGVSHKFEFTRDYASLALFWPSDEVGPGRRALMGNSLGHVYLGEPPQGVGAKDRQPGFASVVGQGAPEHLNNMLLQNGAAIDGTRWQRVEALEGDIAADIERDMRVRVVRTDGEEVRGFELDVMAPRFGWDPSFTAIQGEGAVAANVAIQPADGSIGTAEARGVPARGLRARLRHNRDRLVAVLRPGDARMVNGELLVVLRDGALIPDKLANEQAWVAEALRRFHEFQMVAKAATKIDVDGDGLGEFGAPDEVVPARSRRYRRAPGGRFAFNGHLFEISLPETADGREQRFAAWAWPVKAQSRHDRAFGIDERGVVMSCSASQRFAGDASPVTSAAWQDRSLRWRPIEPR
ncbi:MAG: hypothetical protein NXI31_02450 [bacterium]|nr:hypothetical protein [bacterium]